MIDDRTRSLLFGASGVLCAVGLCLLPVAGQSALQIHTARQTLDDRLSGIPVTEPADDPVPVRDPFASEDAPQGNAAVKPVRAAVAVRAIIAGDDPHALVEEAGRIRIVQLGDPLRSATVRAITTQGLVLSDGTALRLEALP